MLVFIDESGDPGFKIERGSSPVFVMSMVMFQSDVKAQEADEAIRQCAIDCRVKPEWKFNNSSNEKRDAFFECISGLDFKVRAISVDKAVLYSHELKTNPSRFYNFFTKSMLKHDNGRLSNAKIIIDGSGDRRLRQELGRYLKQELPKGSMRKLSFRDSRDDRLVQLADMTAGAIARSYSDRAHKDRWRRSLQRAGRVDNIWNFG